MGMFSGSTGKPREVAIERNLVSVIHSGELKITADQLHRKWLCIKPTPETLVLHLAWALGTEVWVKLINSFILKLNILLYNAWW